MVAEDRQLKHTLLRHLIPLLRLLARYRVQISVDIHLHPDDGGSGAACVDDDAVRWYYHSQEPDGST